MLMSSMEVVAPVDQEIDAGDARASARSGAAEPEERMANGAGGRAWRRSGWRRRLGVEEPASRGASTRGAWAGGGRAEGSASRTGVAGGARSRMERTRGRRPREAAERRRA